MSVNMRVRSSASNYFRFAASRVSVERRNAGVREHNFELLGKHMRATFILILLLGSLGAPRTVNAQLADKMIEFAQALDEIRVLTYRALPQNSPQREALLTATQKLEVGALELQEHAGSDDASLLAHALAQSSRLLRFAISRRDHSQVEQLLSRATAACAGCHARKLPSKAPRYASTCPQGAPTCDIEPAANIEELIARTRYWIATRQFERAAAESEQWIAKRAQQKLGTDELPALIQLADVSVGHLNDPRRLQKTLRAVPKENVDSAISGTLDVWLSALAQYIQSNSTATTPELALTAAQELINPSFQHGYVESERIAHLLARKFARKVHDSAQSSALLSAQASFLLGLIEHRLSGGGWVPLRELYFEEAILDAPHTTLARRAYRALDLSLQAAMTGAERDPEVEQHLQRLKALTMP